MVTGLLPITGIPLLLMSYGGSSVLASMIGIGLVLNISLKKRNYMFSEDD
jgi:rod shape determining protein RodA